MTSWMLRVHAPTAGIMMCPSCLVLSAPLLTLALSHVRTHTPPGCRHTLTTPAALCQKQGGVDRLKLGMMSQAAGGSSDTLCVVVVVFFLTRMESNSFTAVSQAGILPLKTNADKLKDKVRKTVTARAGANTSP